VQICAQVSKFWWQLIMAKILLFTLVLGLNAFAYDFNKLQVGDVLLQPLNCWVCNLIEGEENTPFSHIGIVGRNLKGEKVVFEAYGSVKATLLTDFLKRTQKGESVVVMRHEGFDSNRFAVELNKLYYEDFDQLAYDSAFLINNVDEYGNEKIYCSELVYYLLNPFVQTKLELKRMHFDYFPELWDRYFKGKTPRDEWGISPADISRHFSFKKIGEL
jgi:hypothetical protein